MKILLEIITDARRPNLPSKFIQLSEWVNARA